MEQTGVTWLRSEWKTDLLGVIVVGDEHAQVRRVLTPALSHPPQEPRHITSRKFRTPESNETWLFDTQFGHPSD